MSTMRPPDRILKKLGIQPSDLLTSALNPTSAGQLRRNEFLVFWDQIAQSTPSTNYLIEILTRFLTLADAPSNTQPSIESYLNTISFIILSLDINYSDTRFKRLLEQWSRIDPNKVIRGAKETMRLLSLKIQNANDLPTDAVITPLIIACSTMYSVSEFQKFTDSILYPTLNESDLSSIESSFIYTHLQRICSVSMIVQSRVLTSTFNKMLTLPQQMKVNPKVAETTFCSLLHMLNSFMSLQACTDSIALKQSLTTLQQFYLWPCPYGNLTRDLLFKLQIEAQLPGSFMRARLIEECCGVAEYVHNEFGSGVYYFTDLEDRLSLSYASLLELRNFVSFQAGLVAPGSTAQSALLTPLIQCCVILNMFFVDLSVESADLMALAKCSPDIIYQFYKKCLSIGKEMNERFPSGATIQEEKNLRIHALSQLREQIRQVSSRSNVEYTDLSSLIPPYAPPLPPVIHVQLAASASSPSIYRFGDPNLPPQTPHFDAFCQLLACFSKLPSSRALRIIVAGGDEVLHSFVCAFVLALWTQPNLFRENLQLKFYLIPLNRNAVAAFIARHDSWYNRHIYSVFRTNALSTNSHLVVPSMKLFDSSTTDEEMRTDENSISAIGVFLRHCVENYVREAQLVCEMHVYRVQCSMGRNNKENSFSFATGSAAHLFTVDHTIPALQRVEVGVAVALARYRMNKAISSNITNEEILLNDKNFVYSPSELVVRFTRMDLSGRVCETTVEDSAIYQQILLSNVARKNDLCFPPDPTAPYLEMYAKLHKNYNKTAGKKNILLTDPKQHVVEVEIFIPPNLSSPSNQLSSQQQQQQLSNVGLTINSTSGTLSPQSANSPTSSLSPNSGFHVLIDGQLFGPYQYIKISAAQFPTGEPQSLQLNSSTPQQIQSQLANRIKLPIQTFFPLDM